MRMNPDAVSVGQVIADELEARGWSTARLALEMNQKSIAIDQLAIELTIAISDPECLLGDDMAERIGKALGVSGEFLLNIEKSYRESKGVALETGK